MPILTLVTINTHQVTTLFTLSKAMAILLDKVNKVGLGREGAVTKVA